VGSLGGVGAVGSYQRNGVKGFNDPSDAGNFQRPRAALTMVSEQQWPSSAVSVADLKWPGSAIALGDFQRPGSTVTLEIGL
jgi:hypothetical protein